MTPAHALLLAALLLAASIAAYAWNRWGPTAGIASLLGGLGLVAGLVSLWRMFKPLPERPLPKRLPDAPLPEAEAEARKVEEHEAHVAEMARVKAIPDDKKRRDELARLARAKWKQGPDSTGGAT